MFNVNALLENSDLVDGLIKQDLSDKSAKKKTILADMKKLKTEMAGLNLGSVQVSQEKLNKARVAYEKAQSDYQDLLLSANQKRRILEKRLQANELELRTLEPLIVQRLRSKLTERLHQLGFLTPERSQRLHKVTEEIESFTRVDDAEAIARRVPILEDRILEI
ncbi:hypothetical protein GO003_014745 [Methylicorpusculum oleiharenae]|uniref:hypothetical protein n=1 Tax=Methylicorpusculum oleiharenae TaxID=1338687 RepID=UPI001358B5AC|nr:hypothetical protein [Methylicorpusculum oleiharenae]MCD2451651.1 hypothetical protein [Methylicorpusculum oleiharenae]